MTDAPSEPAGDTKPHVWFPDTGALVTLAVHRPLQRAVVATLSAHDRVLVEAVVAELEGLTATSHVAAAWAGMALSQLDWLGAPGRLDDSGGTPLPGRLPGHIRG